MSYDLFFRTDRDPPGRASLRAWFTSRARYTVSEGSATYRDEATGVAFAFELTDEARPGTAPIAFVMDLPRPGSFAIEAEAEVQALVAAFALSVFDPQPDGMGEGSYSREGFLRGWRSANADAHRALLRSRPDAALPTLSAATNAAVLAWNRAREAYADRLCSVESLPCTVPPVLLVAPRGDDRTVLTAVVWDGEPAALPEVDVVLAAPDDGPVTAMPQVALRPWLYACERRAGDHRFGRSGAVHVCGLPHWIADTDTATGSALQDALRAGGSVRALVRVPPERVLDRETVASARAVFRTPPGAVPRL